MHEAPSHHTALTLNPTKLHDDCATLSDIGSVVEKSTCINFDTAAEEITGTYTSDALRYLSVFLPQQGDKLAYWPTTAAQMLTNAAQSIADIDTLS